VAAVAAGVAKVNVNAELRRAYLAALDADVGDDIARLQASLVAAITRVATEKLVLLSGGRTNITKET